MGIEGRRVELYKNSKAQALLGKFLSGELGELAPVYRPGLGYSYPLVEDILGEKGAKAEGFLNKLYEAGILERKLVDKLIFCPKCGSANVSVRLCCPYCKSFDIRKSCLIEHVKCGYMDVEENFRKSGQLVCQKCHNELTKPEIDYRRAGVWCTCRSCGKSFDIPVTSFLCRDCGESFTFEDTMIKDVYSFTLSDQARQEASGAWVLVAPIKEFLVGRGLDVESPGFVKGKSGANHMFDIVARNVAAEGITVVDLATSTEDSISEQHIIALFAKIFDVSPEKAYLIAVPKINDNGRRMAELYNIQLIEGSNQNEAVQHFKERMKA